MPVYKLPRPARIKKLKKNQVYLLASGDLRLSANQMCWPAQAEMEAALTQAVKAAGYELVRAHPYKKDEKHGFISSQQEGMKIFSQLDPAAPLIVAESVWQYTHHVLAGLTTHQGPILTVANWSGQWPGLVGMLNLNGSLTKAGVNYSTLWSEDFSSKTFSRQLDKWLITGAVKHPLSHVTSSKKVKIPATLQRLGQSLAGDLKTSKAIMGVFDEGCMGMFNAIIPDHILHETGVFKERLSQSALYYASTQVSSVDAEKAFKWYIDKGMKFNFGPNGRKDLTKAQVLQQCRMYIAAVRIADEFGCDAIGIQYQQGMKDLLPASDLVEGTLNNGDRPPVFTADGKREIRPGKPIVNFNEVDECAGLDGIMIQRLHAAMKQPLENTLHDLRWGDADQSGTTDQYVWVFQISGSVPPAHFAKGWKDASGERQPAMYFRLGGSTIKGICKPGEIIWSRIYVANDKLNMDIGRGESIKLPAAETERRWQSTTPQWPMMHAVLYGIGRDQMMAKHQANHIQVVYATNAQNADAAMLARIAMANAMGITVNVCGTKKNGRKWA